jgi:transcriptional regulator with XRE-family HTH domain
MSKVLQHWRTRHNLTQVEAAGILGVSQPYLSLLEKGLRPLTSAVRGRMDATGQPVPRADTRDDDFRRHLAALGYAPMAHIPKARSAKEPEQLLLSILSAADVDPRVVEGLPWLVREYAARIDFAWLVRHAKLRNLQNRLGFLLQVAGVEGHETAAQAIRELEDVRLLQESTLCWDSMPVATRTWMRRNRTRLARHWNILTRMNAEDAANAAA